MQQPPAEHVSNMPGYQSYSSQGSRQGMASSDPQYEYSNETPQRKVLNERIVNASVSVPKRVVREEIVEDFFMVKERIIEIAKPITQEKIVEVPEIEYVDKIQPVIKKIYEEKIKEVPEIEYCERIIEVPKIIKQNKYVEVPVTEFKEVVTEKVIEIPETHQTLTVKQLPVPNYVDENGLAVKQPVTKVERKIPVPVEAVTTYEYQLLKFRERRTKVQFPMYVPNFKPVFVPEEHIEKSQLEAMKKLSENLEKLVGPQAVGLNEIEELQEAVESTDYASKLPTPAEAQQMIREKWLTGQLQVSAGPEAGQN